MFTSLKIIVSIFMALGCCLTSYNANAHYHGDAHNADPNLFENKGDAGCQGWAIVSPKNVENQGAIYLHTIASPRKAGAKPTYPRRGYLPRDTLIKLTGPLNGTSKFRNDRCLFAYRHQISGIIKKDQILELDRIEILSGVEFNESSYGIISATNIYLDSKLKIYKNPRGNDLVDKINRTGEKIILVKKKDIKDSDPDGFDRLKVVYSAFKTRRILNNSDSQKIIKPTTGWVDIADLSVSPENGSFRIHRFWDEIKITKLTQIKKKNRRGPGISVNATPQPKRTIGDFSFNSLEGTSKTLIKQLENKIEYTTPDTAIIGCSVSVDFETSASVGFSFFVSAEAKLKLSFGISKDVQYIIANRKGPNKTGIIIAASNECSAAVSNKFLSAHFGYYSKTEGIASDQLEITAAGFDEQYKNFTNFLNYKIDEENLRLKNNAKDQKHLKRLKKIELHFSSKIAYVYSSANRRKIKPVRLIKHDGGLPSYPYFTIMDVVEKYFFSQTFRLPGSSDPFDQTDEFAYYLKFAEEFFEWQRRS